MSATKPPKISVALCTYNGAKFLSEQLESIKNQTRPPDEIVVGDDCSSDKTVEIIEDFAKSAPFPVELKINKKNLGSTKNFEQTISRCTGDLIFLSDQDDIWLTEKIAVIEREFKNNSNLGVVFSDAELIDENSNLLGFNLWDFMVTEDELKYIKNGKGLETLLRRNVVTGATMAFRADLREKFMPILQDVPGLIHDGWIALFCAIYNEIGLIEKPTIQYRQHSNQQIGVDWQRKQTKELSDKLSQKLSGRSANYEDSIKFSLQEIERIKKITQILKYNLHSATSENLQIVYLDKVAEKFILEKIDNIAHYEARNNLPQDRLKRILPILREIRTGRYRRFSRGFLSAAKDLLESWK